MFAARSARQGVSGVFIGGKPENLRVIPNDALAVIQRTKLPAWRKWDAYPHIQAALKFSCELPKIRRLPV
jgi:hypothetical protein